MKFLLYLFLFLLLVLLTGCANQTSSYKPEVKYWGKIDGEVKTQWDRKGREMTLLEDTKYIDQDNNVWIAQQGDKINGASIPKIFWSLIGGPYEGDYRWASVFHDVECHKRNNTWESVHYMFYTAMRANGVPQKKAKVMYAAVYKFGPRWKLVGRTAIPIKVPQAPTVSEVKNIQQIVETNPAIGDLENQLK
jgi:uncharacterized protein DUF1353